MHRPGQIVRPSAAGPVSMTLTCPPPVSAITSLPSYENDRVVPPAVSLRRRPTASYANESPLPTATSSLRVFQTYSVGTPPAAEVSLRVVTQRLRSPLNQAIRRIVRRRGECAREAGSRPRAGNLDAPASGIEP